jgi:hypothetical protein
MNERKIKRLERNKKYCEDFSQANNYRPLYVLYYEEVIKKLREEEDG